MKKIYFLLFTIICFTADLLSQCAYNNTLIITTPVPTQPTTINGIKGGDMVRVTGMQKNHTYKFSTCGASWDTRLTLYSSGGGQLLAFNDDACGGIGSEIIFSPNYNGDFDILLDGINFLGSCANTTTSTTLEIDYVAPPPSLVTIPVVFHLINSSSSDSITDEQVYEQLDALNNGFSNGFYNDVPNYFKAISADIRISFCLAQRDPLGNPTNGITRRKVASNNFSLDAGTLSYAQHYSQGGIDEWQPQKYLNIWVCHITDFAGYAYGPGFTTNSISDGVIIRDTHFGFSGTANLLSNGGRTTVHEVGHWLSLRHIWGDDCSPNGNSNANSCDGSDEVDDTPNQECQSLNNILYCGQVTDNCTTKDPGIMYNDFMDYGPSDERLKFFTIGQRDRMRACLSNFRSSILTSNGCTPPPTNCPSGATCLTNNTSVNVCSGTFYDAGGTGNYFNNQSFTKTFTPSTTGKKLKFEFTTFNTEHNKDILTLYDGSTMNSPLIGVYSGNLAPFSVEATNPTGAITAKWVSDNTNANIGWAANISCIDNDCTIPPGNYKKIEMYGLNINPNTNNLEFMYHAYTAQQGDPVVNIQQECATLKKIFKTAIVTPNSKQWISIDPTAQYYTQSWGNVVQPFAPFPFRNSEMANRMFMADLYLKEFWDAQLRVNAMNYWKGLALQSSFWSSIHQKGFNNYAFFPSRAAIIPGQVAVNTSGNSVQVNQALLSVESQNYHTPYILPWDMDLNLLSQQERNSLNSKLQPFDTWITAALVNREQPVRNLLNNNAVFDNIRQIYTTIALAKKYKLWNYPNKPMANLINSENMTGISDPMIPDQTIVNLWNQSYTLVPQLTQTIAYNDFNGTTQHFTHGGCVMGNINPIDLGSLNSIQVLRDTAVFQNKSWIAQDSTIYFYGGTLDFPIADLLGIIQPQTTNYILGDTIQVNTTIFNFGNTNAQQFPVRLYEQYTNAQNQLQTILISQQIIGNLDSFSNQSISFAWIPQTYGDKKLILTIDEGNQVIEKKETNNIASDSLFIQNNAPSVTITSPFNGTALSNKNITLSGTAYDPRDGYLNYNNLTWTSSIDGFLGNGSFLKLDSLSVGNHTITFSGTNTHGQTAFAYANLYLLRQGFPSAIILSPIDSAILPNNSPVFLSGEATDLDDGSLCNTATWSSSIDGTLGASCTLSHSLSIGNHTITLMITNSSNNTSTSTTNVLVVNGLPSVSIVQPIPSTSFYQHQLVTLQASATDFPQGNISNLIKWYSNIQGYLGTGQSLSVLLSQGNHIITASIQDNAGSIASATVSVTIKYTPPVSIIIQPVANQTLNYHDTLTFIGHATDLQDGALHGSNLRWYSTLNGFLGLGDTLKIASLTFGAHTISLKAIDSNGADSTVKVLNIYIDAGQPTCIITQPANGANFFYGNLITLSGTATDPQNGMLTGSSIKWYSDVDGFIGTGSSISTNSLSTGNQTVTLSVTDQEGFTNSTSINFYVEPPHTPVISIYHPFNNYHFLHGSTVTLKASAFDYEEGVLNNNRVTWSSSINGSLGIGKTISVSNLSPGTHVISATAIDTTALTTTATIQIIIDQQKPVAQITSPISGSVFSQGTNIVFTGTANDYEDGILTGSSLQWSSDVNGYLGSGNSVNTSSLSIGSHLIKLIASDTQNGKDTTTIVVVIQALNSIRQTTFFDGADSIIASSYSNSWDSIIYVSIPKDAIVVNAQAKIEGSGIDLFGRIDSSFNSNDIGNAFGDGFWGSSIFSSVIQSDGKILVGGSLSIFQNGAKRDNLVRLNTDGTLDSTFNFGVGANNTVYTISLQADGKIIAGGNFTQYGNNLVRLNVDGSVDLSFNAAGIGPNQQVKTSCIQTDGKFIIGGDFTQYNGSTINRIARLNVNGTLDTTFFSGIGANSTVLTSVIQNDGKIIIGGAFTSYNGISYSHIARLNSNGTLDTFNVGTGANQTVRCLAIQNDKKVLVGGDFSNFSFLNNGGIVRLDTSGLPDASFNIGSGANGSIRIISIQNDGKILAGGAFTTFNGLARNKLIRLNEGGESDTSFAIGSGFNNLVLSMNILNNAKTLIFGNFTTYRDTTCNSFTRLDQNGSIDLSYNKGTGANSGIQIAKITSDNKILIGGNFTSFNGTTANRIAKLHSNGSIDSTFNTGIGANDIVGAIAIQNDSKIILTGAFTTFNGVAKNKIVRLNANGSIDSSFSIGSGANNYVSCVNVQADGKIIIGGSFTLYNGLNRNYLARLNVDGSIDPSFNIGSGANNQVRRIVIQNDGKFIIVGAFTSFNGISCSRIARLNPDGSFDNSFNTGSGLNSNVWAVSLQNDGKILIGGDFTNCNGFDAFRIARLFGDGSIDTSFNSGLGANNYVWTTEITDDGKIIIGGYFTLFNGQIQKYFARLNNNGTLINQGAIEIGGNGFDYVVSTPIESNGKIIIAGFFEVVNGLGKNRITRIYSNDNYPKNPFLDVTNNGTSEWYYNGSYHIAQITNNFATEINGYLAVYNGSNNLVQVPLKLHSDSAGVIKVKDLDIQYLLTDTILPNFIKVQLLPNSLAKNSSFTVRVKVSDNERVDSVKSTFKNTTYSLSQISTDSFQVTIFADTVGYFPVTISVSDTNGLTRDTILYVTVFSTTRDLEVLSNNINITPVNIFTNDSVHLTCFVKNNSNLTITNAQVSLIVDGVSQQTKTVTLSSLTQAQLNFDWLAKWGQHKVDIKADPINMISEANENNNTGTQYISVNDIYVPVILQASATPNPAFVGNVVLFKVKAIDSTGIASVTVNWQSQNVALTYNSLTTFYEGYINANTAGTSNAIVTAYDVNGLSSSTGLSIQVLQNLADLKVYSSDILLVPSVSGSGDSASIQIKVRNSGSINANNANVMLRADGVNIGSQSATILHDSSLIFTFTWQVNCGSHTFLVVLDSANSITETNEANNTASFVHQFCAVVPSYVLNTQAIPSVISLGSSTNIQLTSVPSVTNATVSTVWNNQVIAMPFNSLNSNYAVLITPTQTGPYTLPVVFTDANGLQTATFVQFSVIDSLPDLSVNSFSTIYPAQANANTTFSVSVSNNSMQTISNNLVHLLVDNQVVDSILIAVLNPFDSITVSLSWLSITGTHQVTAAIDFHNLITENNEANNSKTIQLSIQDNQPPLIHFVNTTSPIYQGGNTQVSSYVSDNDSVIAVVANFMGSNYPMLYDSVSGIWKVTLNTTSSGTYPLTITATDNSLLTSSATISVLANSYVPDLEIKAQNIIAIHVDSITNTVFAIIQNLGGGISNNVKVHFAINGILMDSVSQNFTAGQSDTVIFTFNYPAGFYTVSITIDPNNSITESNENNNSASRKIFIPDLTAPPSPMVTVVPSGWSASPSFTVSWNQVFDNSGIVTYEYSVNGSVWTNVGTNLSASVTAVLEGLSYVYVRAKDAFGNVSQPGIGEMKYDNTAPNAPLIAEYHCGSSWTTHESPYLEWLNPGDIGSGIEYFEVSIDNASPLSIGFNFNHHPVLTSGIHTLKIRAVDYVNHFGNWSNVVTVYIDLDNPACPNIVSPTHPNQNIWYQNDSLVLNWNHPTETSSVTGFFYMLNHDTTYFADQSSYWIGQDSLTLTAIPSMDTSKIRIPDGIWYVHISSQDTVGHLSSQSCSYRFMIDKTPPFTTALYNDTVQTCNYTFNLHSEDYYSGIANTYYRVNNGSWINDTIVSLQKIGSNIVEFYSVDFAGNNEHIDTIIVYLKNNGLALNLGNDTTVCGSFAVYAPLGFSYLWSNGSTSSFIHLSNSEFLSLQITDSLGCVISDSINVSIISKPVAAFNYSQNKNVVTFTNQSLGASIYNWQFGDGDTSTIFNPSHSFVTDGIYIISLTALSDSCGSSIYNDTLEIVGTDIINPTLSDGSIFVIPNPTEGVFYLVNNRRNLDSLHIYLTNSIGQRISIEGLKGDADNETKFDISSLASGVYNLILSDEISQKVIRIVKF
jgi:uncharacterized delta-60 repeat protein